jgi:hypothetical protein
LEWVLPYIVLGLVAGIGMVIGWVAKGAKKATDPLPDDVEAIIDAEIDKFAANLKIATENAKVQTDAAVTLAIADGKVTIDEAISVIKVLGGSIKTAYKATFSAETKASAGTIWTVLKAWLYGVTLGKLKKVWAKLQKKS